jgi:hypothetical protein
VLSILSVLRIAVAIADDAADRKLLEELSAKWEAQQSEVATAYMRYRLISTGPSGVGDLTSKDVRRFVGSVNLAQRPDDLRLLFQKLHNHAYATDVLRRHTHPWSVMEFYTEGSRTREDRHGSGETDLHVFDGEQEVLTDSANRQADIYRGRSAYLRRTLGHFRFVPPSTGIEALVVKGRSAEGIVLKWRDEKSSLEEVVVDGATALVTRMSEPGRELLQRDFVTYSGNIVFPSLVVHARYKPSGTLSDLTITLVEEARFNEDLPANTFSVAAAAGTNVFDHRGGPGKDRSFHVAKGASDLTAHIDELTAIGAAAPTLARKLTVAAGICALVALLLFLVLRKGRRQMSH